MPPTSSDGSPATVINTPQGPVYIDSVTGEILGAGAPVTSGAPASGDVPRGQVTPGGPAAPINPPFDLSTDRIIDQQKLPDGSSQARFIRPDGSSGVAVIPADQADAVYRANQIALQEKQLNATNAATGASTTNARIQAQTAAANLAEQQRQFNETFGMDKAKYNQDFAQKAQQFAATQDLNRGNTLLGLGSRPDTLIKYLYAMQGQQVPQGIQGTTNNLPGYSNYLTTNNGMSAPTIPLAGLGAASPSVAAPGPTPQQQVLSAIQAPPKPGDLANLVAPGGTNITATDPRTNSQIPTTPGNINTFGAQDALIAQGRTPRFFSDGAAIFDKGGVIPEPVVGTGMVSGQPYMFGEKGPEGVVPNDQMPKDMQTKDMPKDIFEQMMRQAKGDIHYSEDDGKTKRSIKMNHYDSGGTIGYDPNSLMAKYGDPTAHASPYYANASPVNTTALKPMDIGWPSSQTQPNGAAPGVPSSPYPALRNLTNPANSYPGLRNLTNPTGTTQPSSSTSSLSGLPGLNQTPGAVVGNGGFGGYNPTNVPAIGSLSAGFFNDPRLRNVVARGYNSNPGVPLFPQISLATGGGASLVPSMQRFNALLPSEQSLYAGALQDEFGAQPNDVFALSKQLAPGATNLRTPKYSA